MKNYQKRKKNERKKRVFRPKTKNKPKSLSDMKIYTLKFEQTIPITLSAAWAFFSAPHNLAQITPVHMGFVITSDYSEEQKMYPGMIISYDIAVFKGMRVNWVTEITHVDEHKYFIDEQRFGPYSFWHHQHHFVETAEGVHMTDIVNYAIPYGFLGRLVNDAFVENEVKKIFRYRKEMIQKLFPGQESTIPTN